MTLAVASKEHFETQEEELNSLAHGFSVLERGKGRGFPAQVNGVFLYDYPKTPLYCHF